jgi:hypothetical protein
VAAANSAAVMSASSAGPAIASIPSQSTTPTRARAVVRAAKR